MNKIKKKVLMLSLVSIFFVIFMIASEASFSKAFDRDLFPSGRPEYLEYSEVFHEKNVAWLLLGSSKQECETWIKNNSWGVGVQWQDPHEGEKSYKNKWFDKIFHQYNVDISNIEKIHSKIVDGSDVSYLITLSEPIDGQYFVILCVFRS
jgi:hypothetical protein